MASERKVRRTIQKMKNIRDGKLKHTLSEWEWKMGPFSPLPLLPTQARKNFTYMHSHTHVICTSEWEWRMGPFSPPHTSTQTFTYTRTQTHIICTSEWEWRIVPLFPPHTSMRKLHIHAHTTYIHTPVIRLNLWPILPLPTDGSIASLENGERASCANSWNGWLLPGTLTSVKQLNLLHYQTIAHRQKTQIPNKVLFQGMSARGKELLELIGNDQQVEMHHYYEKETFFYTKSNLVLLLS